MSKKIKIFYILFSVLILTFSCQKEKKQSNEFVAQDVHNFYHMLSLIENANSLNDTLKILSENYLRKASIGLNDYLDYEKNSNNRDIEQEYLKIIRSFPKYFKSQKSLLSDIENKLDDFDKYFQNIKEVYPHARFQPTYFSIGFFNTQGQMIPPKTVFISLEACLRNDSTNYSEFPKSYSWLQEEPATYRDLGYVIVHENLHTLQKNNSKNNSLLDQAINEGAAVFLTEYFCGKESLIGSAGINQNMIDYAVKNRTEVWTEFGKDFKKPENLSKWFWSSNSKYPYSMGYYMGYMICKSFYENQKDKQNAIKKLIEINDPNFIFENSQFKKFVE